MSRFLDVEYSHQTPSGSFLLAQQHSKLDLTPEASYELQRVDIVSVPENLQQVLPEHLQTATIVRGRPKPIDLVAVADFTHEPAPLVLLYLRRPDAQEPAARPQSPAIPKLQS